MFEEAHDRMETLTGSTFDEEINSSEVPVLVDFWAVWCGPCRMVAPVLEQIAGENAGKIRIAKVNVDDEPQLARRYDVMSIPTLLLFKDGVLKKRVVGAKGKGQLTAELAEFL